jgi:hypothetical protein
MWSIACCRCMRVMDAEGKPAGDPINGPLDVALHFAKLKEVAAVFKTKEEADQAGQSFGWTIVDGNHRCPECYVLERAREVKTRATQRTGCYIDWGADQ